MNNYAQNWIRLGSLGPETTPVAGATLTSPPRRSRASRSTTPFHQAVVSESTEIWKNLATPFSGRY